MSGPEDTVALTLFAPDTVLEPQLIPMEINLEGWPLFSRQKTPEGGAKEARRSLSTPDGRRLEQLWRITSSHDFSLPGTFDEDVFVGVMALVRQRGGMPQDGKIRFSLYELIKVLKKKKRGTNYPKVRESLDRMASTIYYSENAFYDASEGESLETYRFTLWTIHFSRAKGAHGRAAEHHTLKFDDAIIRSYNAGYLKLLDTDLYFALKLPLAKALYRLVDQRRSGSASWSVDARELRDLLMMSDKYKAPSRIWEVLAPAHRALRREKYLESAMLDGDTVHYKVHPNCTRSGELGQEELGSSLDEGAVEALVRLGVWANRARVLVARFGPEKAFHALDILEARQGEIGNRGAYVAEVIEKADPEELADMAGSFTSSKAPREGSNPGRSREPSSNEQGSDSEADLPEVSPADREAAEEAWPKVLQAVGEKIDSPAWRVWFEGTKPHSLVGGAMIVAVQNDFAKEYIEDRFKASLEEAITQVLAIGDAPSSVECVVEPARAHNGR